MDTYGSSVTERIKNFDAAHGPAAYDGHWLYYADGASREGSPLGALHEPPADARQRNQTIVRHHQILLDEKVREFDAVKKALTENPGHYPDHGANLAKLKALQGEAQELKARLSDAQAELKRHLPGYRTPEEEAEHARMMAADAEARARYAAELDAITI